MITEAQRRYRSTDKYRATAARYAASDAGKTARRKANQRSFVKFKKELTIRIQCLRQTSPAFRESRIQEILAWAGGNHTYWVESEITNCAAC